MKHTDLGSDADDRLPRIPPLTPERLAELDAIQKERAANHPLDTSPEGRENSRADAVIRELELIPRARRSAHQKEQLAEALYTVGRYEEAEKLRKDKRAKKVHEAVWKDDDEICNCKDHETVEMVDGRPQKVKRSRHFVVGRIFSHKHSDHVNLMQCSVCGHQNAK